MFSHNLILPAIPLTNPHKGIEVSNSRRWQFDDLVECQAVSCENRAMDESMAQSATQLFNDWQSGNPEALDELVPILYQECRQLAQHIMNHEERPQHTLQATELVHEAFLKLQGYSRVQVSSRNHLMNLLAQIMRRALVDHARKKLAKKREQTFSLQTRSMGTGEPNLVDLLSLDKALSELAKFDKRKEQLVVMKYFANMSIDEIAQVLSISTATVKRDWTVAKAWLYSFIQGQQHET